MQGTFQTLRSLMAVTLAGLFMAVAVHASEIKDSRAIVKPVNGDQFEIGGYTFGKAELFGYISDLKETEKITGIVLKNGKRDDNTASDEQRHSIVSIGKTLQLETFIQDGKELTPLVDE
ncbi:MAG: hypothetical protein EYC71_14045 [Gammaproteobacteria bacterium]|nr:MAG: hypothetical protein EYC71_14045 [Gammaproteobacteria bacterium]